MIKNCLSCGVEFEGSAQARFHSDACRKAYARRGSVVMPETEVDPSLPVKQIGETPIALVEQPEMIEFEGKFLPRVRILSVDEETYVAHWLGEAKVFHEQTSRQATQATQTLKDRLERAERYARWRYRGFVTGEIVSL